MKNLRPVWHYADKASHPALAMDDRKGILLIFVGKRGVVSKIIPEDNLCFLRPMAQSTDRTLKSMAAAAKRRGANKKTLAALKVARALLKAPAVAIP